MKPVLVVCESSKGIKRSGDVTSKSLEKTMISKLF